MVQKAGQNDMSARFEHRRNIIGQRDERLGQNVRHHDIIRCGALRQLAARAIGVAQFQASWHGVIARILAGDANRLFVDIRADHQICA